MTYYNEVSLRRRLISDTNIKRKEWNSMPQDFPLPQVYPIKLGSIPLMENPVDDYQYLPPDVVANEIRIIVIANNPDP
jgi:hypothetical protein